MLEVIDTATPEQLLFSASFHSEDEEFIELEKETKKESPITPPVTVDDGKYITRNRCDDKQQLEEVLNTQNEAVGVLLENNGNTTLDDEPMVVTGELFSCCVF